MCVCVCVCVFYGKPAGSPIEIQSGCLIIRPVTHGSESIQASDLSNGLIITVRLFTIMVGISVIDLFLLPSDMEGGEGDDSPDQPPKGVAGPKDA